MLEAKIRYEDLLSGDVIPVTGVGHVRSPKLKEMAPTSGIGWSAYNLYLTFLKAGKELISKALKKEVESDDQIFNEIIQDESLRELYEKAFSFFICENVQYNDEFKCYLVIREEDGEKPHLEGLIDAERFDYARSAILLANYVSLDKTSVSIKHSSAAAKAAWERAQAFLSEQESKEDEAMSFGNMLSKVCTIHPSLNYLNVFELTMFQFYDTFFQCCYMRSTEFSESIVAQHGSKDFQYTDWMNPVKNY